MCIRDRYPAHGVGKIESIESKSIGGKRQDFYIMRILDNSMKIMIPVPNAETVGLRGLDVYKRQNKYT